MSITLYGIKNCDTMKKARRYLEENDIQYHFHDYRKDGIDIALVQHWIDRLGWDTVLNKRGTTWRKLSDAERNNTDASNAASLLCREPAMIKRPVLADDNWLLIGFSQAKWDEQLSS